MKFNKKLITIALVILATTIMAKLAYIGVRKIQIDEFTPAAVMFLVDSSASNQKNLPTQRKTLKQICNLLDPEDEIKIIRVSEDAYLIYEGSPLNTSEITKSMEKFTAYDEKDYGTAYGAGLEKALTHTSTMYELGYTPAIIIIGDLENEGDITKQINWDTLANDIEHAKANMPEISMMFLGAHPEKLDLVKETLTPILGETKLVIGNDQTVDKQIRTFLKTLGR
ncbi:MAG: VWA domain-containing protein [Candidatus Gastranaerophilales bacterium]